MRQWPQWRREQIWELRAKGLSIHAIAREMGVFRPSVTRYLNLTGGVRPRPRKRAERCLSASEREEISRGLARGESFRAIGQAIGRPHTTVPGRGAETGVAAAPGRGQTRLGGGA